MPEQVDRAGKPLGLAGRLLGLLTAVGLTLPALLHQPQFYPLDHVNLVFHEAGHVLMMWAGETPMLLAGSLTQLLVPLACGVAFLWRQERYAAGLMGLWLGESLANVSAYIADAPTRELDLITGDPDTHDWWQLLVGWNALDAAGPLGRGALALGMLIWLSSVLLALWDDIGHLERRRS